MPKKYSFPISIKFYSNIINYDPYLENKILVQGFNFLKK